MRDEEERDFFSEQKLLHPEDRIEVEVISRLVEEQQSGLGGEGLRQETAALEPAREVIEGPVLGQAEAGN